MARYINDAEFKKIKEMLSFGLTNSQVNKISKRSAFTIGIIKQADDFADYKRITHEVYEKSKQDAQKAKTAEGTAVVANGKNSTDPNVANTLTVINQRLEHVETMLNELIETNDAVRSLVNSKKVIW